MHSHRHLAADPALAPALALRAAHAHARPPPSTIAATKFSATGYVGADVDDIVRDLLPAADGDAALAELGIVYVDEAPRSRRDRAEISRCDGARSAAPSSPGDTAAPAPAYISACILTQIDKIAEPASGRPGVGGGVNTRSVQSALLKLMEDAEVCAVVVALARAAHA